MAEWTFAEEGAVPGTVLLTYVTENILCQSLMRNFESGSLFSASPCEDGATGNAVMQGLSADSAREEWCRRAGGEQSCCVF